MSVENTTAMPRRIVRLPEVEQRTGRSRSSIYRDVAAGRLKPPVKIGPRAIGWSESAIEDWIAARCGEVK